MDARLDKLTTELYQVNTRVSRIAWRQARIGGFTASPSPSPSLQASKDKDDDDASPSPSPSLQASKDKDDDDGSGDDDDDEDKDASSSSDEEMTTSQWLAFCHSWQKGGVVLG